MDSNKYWHLLNIGNYSEWILNCCIGKYDGHLPPFLADKFRTLFAVVGHEFQCKPLTIEFAEQVRDLCKEIFRCFYNYPIKPVGSKFIYINLSWVFRVPVDDTLEL